MPALPEVQSDFGAALRGGDFASLVAMVMLGPIAATDRLAIYRNNRQLSLLAVVRSVFPNTERLLGVADFKRQALAFIDAHPPATAELAAYGAGFADFLRRQLGEDTPAVELAEFEWLCAGLLEHEYAPEMPLTQALPPGLDPLALGFVWHPAAALVTTRVLLPLPMGEVGDHRKTGEGLCLPALGPSPAAPSQSCGGHPLPSGRGLTHLLLRARHGRIMRRILTVDEFAFYQALSQGLPLGTAATRVGDENFDIIASLSAALAFGCFAEMKQ